MIEWTWSRTQVAPDDVLDAMDTIDCGPIHYATLTDKWLPAGTYLSWAQQSLATAGEFGFDAALCYAKRAVCRQIDAFMVNSHLSRFLHSKGYPEKVDALATIGLHSPSIIHDIIIDPRNDIEHEYVFATESQARRAVELARLFLDATKTESERDALIGFGWCIGSSYSAVDKPDEQWEKIEYSLRSTHSPMLLVEVTDPKNHHALVLRPKDGELLACPIRWFSMTQAIEFAKKLRRQLEPAGSNWSRHKHHWLLKLKEDLML